MLWSRAIPCHRWAWEVLGCAAQQQGWVGSSCAQLLSPSTWLWLEELQMYITIKVQRVIQQHSGWKGKDRGYIHFQGSTGNGAGDGTSFKNAWKPPKEIGWEERKMYGKWCLGRLCQVCSLDNKKTKKGGCQYIPQLASWEGEGIAQERFV